MPCVSFVFFSILKSLFTLNRYTPWLQGKLNRGGRPWHIRIAPLPRHMDSTTKSDTHCSLDLPWDHTVPLTWLAQKLVLVFPYDVMTKPSELFSWPTQYFKQSTLQNSTKALHLNKITNPGRRLPVSGTVQWRFRNEAALKKAFSFAAKLICVSIS